MKYDYFDADYFQNGQTKGTVYNNYLEVARSSAIYREIAQLIFDVFRPKRTLEIGCATGIIVKHLNELGVEAHGILFALRKPMPPSPSLFVKPRKWRTNMDWNTVQQLLRILLQFGSGVLISKGILTEEMAVTLTGGLISVASVVWWAVWNKKEVK